MFHSPLLFFISIRGLLGVLLAFSLNNQVHGQSIKNFPNMEGAVQFYTGFFKSKRWKKGQVKDRHKIIADTSLYDSYSSKRVIPEGSEQVIRLGNDNNGAEADRLVYTFDVTTESALFVYQYSIVIQNPGHSGWDQPKFEILVVDINGKILNKKCGYYKVIAANTIPGFFDGRNRTKCKDWVSEAIDLSAWIGKKVRIQFTTYDCALGGHFGYCYLKWFHAALKIDVRYCTGDNFGTAIAPIGFKKYDWQGKGYQANKRMIKLAKQKIDSTLKLKCTLTSVTGCQLTLPANFNTKVSTINILPVVRDATCYGKCDGAIELNVQGNFPPFKCQWKNKRRGSQQANLCAGTYHLTVADRKGCENYQSFFIGQPDSIEVSPKIKPVTCYEGADGTIALHIDPNSKGTHLINWNTGAEDRILGNLTPGKYFYQVSNERACVYDSVVIKVPEKIQALSSVVDYHGYGVSCYGLNDGSVNINVLGGTAPFDIIIEKMIFKNHSGIDLRVDDLFAGYCTITLSDAHNCVLKDSLLISQPPPIEYEIEQSYFNGYHLQCYKDYSGWINIQSRGGAGVLSHEWLGNNKELLGNSPRIEGLSAGYYQLLIKDQNGCFVDTVLKVNQPSKLGLKEINSSFIFNKLAFYTLEGIGGAGGYKYFQNKRKLLFRKRICFVPLRRNLKIIDKNDCCYEYQFVLKGNKKNIGEKYKQPAKKRKSILQDCGTRKQKQGFRYKQY